MIQGTFKDATSELFNGLKENNSGLTFKRIGFGETDFIKNNRTAYVSFYVNGFENQVIKNIDTEIYIAISDKMGKYEREIECELLADNIHNTLMNVLNFEEVSVYEPAELTSEKVSYSIFLIKATIKLSV